MKVFAVILACCVGMALAGVGTLDPYEEKQKWDLFNKFCLSGGGAEYGQDVGIARVYCKRSPQVIQQDNFHEVFEKFPSGHQQEVFVQPPSLDLNHKVVVNVGLGGGATKVYVVPNEVNNRYQVNVRGQGGEAGKPQIYYLKQGSSSANPSKPVYPPQPPQERPWNKRSLVEYPSTVEVVKRDYAAPGY